jgi:hypothetical protein
VIGSVTKKSDCVAPAVAVKARPLPSTGALPRLVQLLVEGSRRKDLTAGLFATAVNNKSGRLALHIRAGVRVSPGDCGFGTLTELELYSSGKRDLLGTNGVVGRLDLPIRLAAATSAKARLNSPRR